MKQTAVTLIFFFFIKWQDTMNLKLSFFLSLLLFCSVDHVTIDAGLEIREFLRKKQIPVRQIRNLQINNQGMKSSSSPSSSKSSSPSPISPNCQTGNKSNSRM